MTDQERTQRLEAQSARFFDRAGFSMPVYVDAEHIAMLDDRNGVPQISLLDLADGSIDVLTSFDERIQTLLASTATGKIVFGMDDGGNERQQIWSLAIGEQPRRLTSDNTAIHEPGTLSKDGQFIVLRSNARTDSTFDVERIDLESGDRTILIRDAGQPSAFDLSLNGEKLIVVSLNANLDADILLLETSSGEVRNLTAHQGEAEIHGACFSADGTSIWLSSNENREFNAVFVLELETGVRTLVFESHWDVEALSPSPDGRWLAVSVNEDGASRLKLIETADPQHVIALDTPWGTFDRFAWSPDSLGIAFGFSTAELPSVVMVAGLNGETSTIAAAIEDDLPTTVTPKVIRFTSFDGREIPAFWFKPIGDGPWPVIVDIHGGPESQRRLSYQPIDQYLVSLGFAVLATNVRGSTGYGKEYVHLDDVDLRLDSVADVAAGVAWLKVRDDVAADQIIVMGQSYGGFMTLASLCFYPDLWAAGFDIVGIANFVTFLERTGPWRRKHREAEYGSLEHDREVLERISPLTHVDNISAPLFLIHGRNDPRVPLFEAEQVHAALQERGRIAELRVFDDEGHGLSKRKNRIVGYAAAAAFLLDHLQLSRSISE